MITTSCTGSEHHQPSSVAPSFYHEGHLIGGASKTEGASGWPEGVCQFTVLESAPFPGSPEARPRAL